MASHRSIQKEGSGTQQKAQDIASDAANTLKSGTKTFRDFIKKFYHDWSLHLTQALTFSLVTSIIPLGILLVAIVGQFIGTLNTSARTQFIQHIQSFLPTQILPTQITQSALQKFSQSSGIWIIVSIITALFFGSRLFTLLEACFDIIYRVPQRAPGQKNLRALIMVLVFMMLTPLLVLASLVPELLLSLLQNTAINTHTTLMHHTVGIVSSLIVSFLLFEIIYTFLPNRQASLQRKLKSSVLGAATAAIFLQIGLIIFPLYASNYTNGVVNQIAFALVFMIFFYLISLVTLVGATVNAYFIENVQPTPHDFVTRASRSN